MDPLTKTELPFGRWIASARYGSRYIYHRGNLGRDREINPEVDDHARAAMALFRNGVVDLVQARVAPNMFDYIAIVKSRRR